MPTTYDYKVRDKEGNLIKGRIEADSVPLVASRLREMGYVAVDIKPVRSLNLQTEIHIPGLTDRVPLKQVAVMSRQLATMMSSGLTLVRSLSVLGDQLDHKILRETLNAVRIDVEHGSSLSVALEKHPKIFGPLYVSMVRAGEAGGQLDVVLMRLSTTIEKQVELRSKIMSALFYPLVVIGVAIGIVTAMMIVIVPIFKRIFSSAHHGLPVPTRIVVAIADVLGSFWLLAVIAAVVIGFVLFKRWIGSPSGREKWDRLKLRPPVFGPLAHKIALARMTGTLSSLVSAGVPIIESLGIVSANVGNEIVSEAVRGAQQGVREGRSLASSLSGYEVVPSMVTQMIDTGEESGALDEMLDKISTFYDNEITATVNSLTAVLEPLIIVFLGLVIAAIIISLWLPMIDYVKLFEQGGTAGQS